MRDSDRQAGSHHFRLHASWWGIASAAFVVCLAAATASPAQDFSVLANFDSTNGSYPEASLIQGTDGNLYGTTVLGGTHGGGEIFKLVPSGALITIYSFCSQYGCTDGDYPEGPLVEGTDGNLYGTTTGGGATGYGTVFKLSRTGALTTLYSFCSENGCADGALPYAGLVQATDSNFYGTTYQGGAYENDTCRKGCGTLFKITPSGAFTISYSFCSERGCKDGQNPAAGLIQATDGNLYGTASGGGSGRGCPLGCGTIFRLTLGGNFTTLRSFNFTDGANPYCTLIQATDGNLYGTTDSGGANGIGVVFKMTPGGILTTLHSFAPAEAGQPVAGLVQATDGNFYGTSTSGGVNDGKGSVFSITPAGTLSVLHSFCSSNDCADGSQPRGNPVQDTNGELYGTTTQGGTDGDGVGYALSMGLGPFLETQPTSGRVQAHVKVLGTNLTGATSVTFNGTAATFSVVSPSLITTTVPVGASTGTVQVVTPAGTLNSNVSFRVIQ